MRHLPPVLSLALALALLPLAPGARADSLDDALTAVGFVRSDLGWRPRGYWLRFPRDIPYKLPAFDDLFAEPLRTVPFVRALGQLARDNLSAAALAAEAERGGHNLYRAVQGLGVDPRFGAFRPYSPNLTAESTPLDEAILRVYRAAGRQTRFVTFGQESPYPEVEKELKAAAAKLPAETSRILGKLVLDVLDAHRYAVLAFRRVPLEQRVAACRRLDLGAESVDALEYAPVVDDVARAWDEASLWYAALKCVEALDTARRALAAQAPAPDLAFDWETPLGWIRVRGGGNDRIDADDALLVVDLGGDDAYAGAVGASSAVRPLGLCLDLSGNDTYRGGRATQGAGLCGVGVLLDAAGDDRYEAEQYAQGVGQFGLGALIDLGGRDAYRARWSAQGCGYFGSGLLFDLGGDDAYELHADGQGFGGVGGLGVLADGAGNDAYTAEPDPAKSGRPSYHSELKVSVSNAQGCAMGRRGDGADGHSWAGGLGALLDVSGDDTYRSGNWSMGTGYWFGMGALWDGGGNDRYRGVVWTQATGAHFCIGALVDEGGDDEHVAESHNSLCFGHDFTVCVLVDGGGDDTYKTPGNGLGYSINRSVALFVEAGGNDRYECEGRPGAARYDARFADRASPSLYWVDASSIGLFLDLGGKDAYPGEALDGRTWADEPGSDNRRVRNPGVGADVEGGAVDWRR